jgi:adsorption protein B
MVTIDRWILSIMAPLALWVVLNGMDDLFVALAAVYVRLRFRLSGHPAERLPSDEELDAVPRRRMAIFICLWQEHRVVREMVENSIRNIRYREYDIFLGVYPNDAPTIAAAKEVCRRFSNVHLSMVPHPGGTSKADNLNWIYQRMLLHEENTGAHFDMIVLHDAEDLIHPDDLRWMNYYAQWYDQVQIPVLALPTPVRQLTHGVYCDEFAEFQFKDMPARELLGGFLPSSGVGTGFSRKALERIAAAHSNQIFDATSLTEDYETGFRVHRHGFRQKFMRIVRRDGNFVATREFFAQSFQKSVRQRSRWVTGIGLQSWGKHGLPETVSQLYWFWRDRKAVVTNLITPLTNLLCAYGMLTWLIARIGYTAWGLGFEPASWWQRRLIQLPVGLLLLQVCIRMGCSSRVYGWKFAAAVPVRILWANIINFCATAKAVWMFLSATVRGRPLIWLKTEHAYPSRAALLTGRRRLGEILTDAAKLSESDLIGALASKPPDIRLGEHLVRLGKITASDLYRALSEQQNLPLGKPESGEISTAVTRAIPAKTARSSKVLPFRVVAGQLYVASPELPSESIANEVREFCPLEVRFHLVEPREFEELADAYLPVETP